MVLTCIEVAAWVLYEPPSADRVMLQLNTSFSDSHMRYFGTLTIHEIRGGWVNLCVSSEN